MRLYAEGVSGMRKKLTTIILVLILLTGVVLLLYPTVSNLLNTHRQMQAVSYYSAEVEGMSEEEKAQMREAASEYNARLLSDTGNRYRMTEEEEQEYESLLDVTGTGIMGYVEIPKLNESLPIYHGTDDTVLQIAIGHLAGSSLPVGGEGTHCVLTGHRGLPSAKLFSNLDKLAEGDLFFLHVLDETLTYEVDQIRVVEPHELENLSIEEGKDYCTLVTCTPYGVNTHRLLVRGHRTENPEEAVRVTADAEQIDRTYVIPAVAVPILLLAAVIAFIHRKFH